MDGLTTEVCGQQKQSNDPGNNQHNPRYANYWAPLTRKRRIPPHPAQPQHTNHWAPRTRKRQQQEHRPQRPTESSDPTQHAKGRTGDCPGPCKETTTRRNVTRGGWACWGVASSQCAKGKSPSRLDMAQGTRESREPHPAGMPRWNLCVPSDLPHPRDALEGEEPPPPPLQGAQPMPSHSLPDARCQTQWHL